LGSYYNNPFEGFPSTATNLSVVTIGTPGVFVITICVEVRLQTSGVVCGAYITGGPGFGSLGFSLPYANGNYQSANTTFIVKSTSSYTFQIMLSSVIAGTLYTPSNSTSVYYNWVRIA
jgi:hypothetical protein